VNFGAAADGIKHRQPQWSGHRDRLFGDSTNDRISTADHVTMFGQGWAVAQKCSLHRCAGLNVRHRHRNNLHGRRGRTNRRLRERLLHDETDGEGHDDQEGRDGQHLRSKFHNSLLFAWPEADEGAF
jgi:hypothetical protein